MNYRMSPPPRPQTYDLSAKLDGWHERARPHSSPPNIDISKAKILIASRYRAMRSSGFNMALFELDSKERIAVDASGQVLILDAEDATAFSTLLDSTLSIPTRKYRIWHLASCRPFDIVTVADSGDQFKEFSIYGYRKSMRDLEDNGGQLPEALWELYGVLEEAKSRNQGEEKDEEILRAVQERLQHLI